jgi:cell division protein FtsB
MLQLRRFPTPALITMAFVASLGYFLYHAEQGKYGVRASHEVGDKVAELDRRLSDLQAERQRLEHLVGLLRPESLDPDMLDEQARVNLGYTHPLELVILDNR